MLNSDPLADDELRRDRLLASVALILGTGLFIALTFALREGAEFFLPLAIAVILSIALVPSLEWFERRRVPSTLSALLCTLLFLLLANGALAVIIVPATDWFAELPSKIPKIMQNLAPVIDLYSNTQKFLDDTTRLVTMGPVAEAQKVATDSPGSLLDLFASAAPELALQMAFVILVIFFFLAGWTKLRENTINSRGSFSGAMATARVIQNVVSATSAYLITISMINCCLGIAVGIHHGQARQPRGQLDGDGRPRVQFAGQRVTAEIVAIGIAARAQALELGAPLRDERGFCPGFVVLGHGVPIVPSSSWLR